MTAVAVKTLDASAVADAAAAIGPHIRRTPTEKSDALSGLAGREVYLKLENLQKTGSFKIRGGLNALMRKDERDLIAIAAEARRSPKEPAFTFVPATPAD